MVLRLTCLRWRMASRPLPPNRTVGALVCGVGGVACLAAGVVMTILGAQAMLRGRRC